jgi:predicted HicB family RNase H-like nuclease
MSTEAEIAWAAGPAERRSVSVIALMLRLPPDLHANLKDCAKENERSLNSEIIHRLRRSLEVYRR